MQRPRPGLALTAAAALLVTGSGCVSWDPIVLPTLSSLVRWWVGC